MYHGLHHFFTNLFHTLSTLRALLTYYHFAVLQYTYYIQRNLLGNNEHSAITNKI